MIIEPQAILQELASDNSRLFKESIIEREARAGNNEFFAGVKLALDNMVTFGIKQVPEKTNENGSGLDWDNFSRVAGSLIDRTLTGHAARDAVLSLMDRATVAQWNNWYRPIILKDLRAGFSETTVNKVVKKKYPQYVIPVFSCQLAHDSTDHASKVVGKKLLSVKLDGVRILTIVYPNGRVDQFSRNGKELVNFPHIKEQFSVIAKSGCIAEPMVFDGEIMSGAFQDLMKQIHRKSDVTTSDAVLHLFDIVPLTAFEQGQCSTNQIERAEQLKAWHEQWGTLMPNVHVLGYELVDLDTTAGKQRFKEINASAIEVGFEGIMIKDPRSPYECKRTFSWLKLKPFITVDLAIVRLEEGTGKNVGKLGAFVCEGTDNGKFIRVNVGSGFTDNQREAFWEAGDSLLNNIVEVKADAITQNQDGSYSLRFPRFERFRGFKQGEKI